MKMLDSLRLFIDCLVGIATGVLLLGAVRVYLVIGAWLLLVLPAILLVWAVGHIIHGIVDTDVRRRCDHCSYAFSNVFTEWFHSRRCLAGIVKKVRA